MAGEVTRLLRFDPLSTLAAMAQRRPRFAFLGALLAFSAMFCLVGLSGWHSASVHDHAPAHAATVEHDHDHSRQADPDGPVHLLAHATGQWIALADPLAMPALADLPNLAWSVLDPSFRVGIDPSELLKPPRG